MIVLTYSQMVHGTKSKSKFLQFFTVNAPKCKSLVSMNDTMGIKFYQSTAIRNSYTDSQVILQEERTKRKREL